MTSEAKLKLLGGLAVLLLIPIAAAWGGFVISVLWGWFIAPLFGLPEISIAQAYGLALVSSLLFHQYIPKDSKQAITACTYEFFGPLFILVIGWITRFFI